MIAIARRPALQRARHVTEQLLHRLVRDDPDPVARHRVASSPVRLQVLDVRGHADELEPLGDRDEHGQTPVPQESMERCGPISPFR